MLRSRIIPCLLIDNRGLVKTVGFKDPKYVGDPLNAVRIFNEKEVDELVVLDIRASAEKREPDFKMIENLAAECRMPLCYGGGITNADQAKRIVSLGVEKVAISSAVVRDSTLVTRVAEAVGRQSVVVVVDVKRSMFGRYALFTGNGKVKSKQDPFDFALLAQQAGAGEIVVNSIDNDGTMGGYDLKLAQRMREIVDLPITVLGGAGKLTDIASLVQRFGLVGAACGSFFVFKGKYRAVLISYPTAQQKEEILNPVASATTAAA
ncbi:AglZ/HisF2 family acetamidino modification protein [Rosistilla oblonga]|uniref:AglZ/HisF2 family acetamidino modification protein n=1 Tax=Rosistilla oblonga TaxID=2527990 RepID=UPI003A980201